MIRTIDQATLIRCLSTMHNGEFDFFLGSGASAQAGIPTGGTMIWDFKRELYCSEKGVPRELYRDLNANIVQKELQEYFDAQNQYPRLYAPEEYAFYFEKCYPTPTARERYILNKVADISPSIGHLCLGNLFISKRVTNIWTTNFDELIEAGIKTLAAHHSFNVYSTANKTIAPANTLSSVIKLHGDYRYDHIKNTPTEIQNLEESMQKTFSESLMLNKGLVVVGYSGSDDSIMHILEENITVPGFLRHGLVWAIPEGIHLSDRLNALMEKASNANESSCIVRIQNFDDFLYRIYATLCEKSSIIEDSWKNYAVRKVPLSFHVTPALNFIKLNSYESMSFPLCMVFDTDISSWKELKEIIGETGMPAALYARHIYCFAEIDEIYKIFGSHVKSSIKLEGITSRILYATDSVYIGMLYSLIRNALTSEFKLIEFKRYKYYDPEQNHFYEKFSCQLYEAIEISLSVYSGIVYLNIVPTVFVTDKGGNPIDRKNNQIIVNSAMSEIYNKLYNDKLRTWNKRLSSNGDICFSYKGFTLSFNKIPLSCGGVERLPEWPTATCYHFSEPEMLFSLADKNKKSVNQLKGISRFAPLDCSGFSQQTIRRSIELAIVSPQEQIQKLLSHLAKLNQPIQPRNPNDGFLTQYSGFETIYRKGLSIPVESDSNRVFLYSQKATCNMNEIDYSNFLKRYIDRLAGQNNFDIAIIYIPNNFSRFRENIQTDFNLHDSIKLYATDKSVKVQFIEERSIGFYDECKVMWGLSTSLYAKASGVLWQPIIMNNETAFIGVSYAISSKKNVCIGCSQLFDSTGTGMRLLLRKISDPDYRGHNPYMKSDEARSIMSALRDQYNKCESINRLKRIVIHKTTQFTQEEIKGFTQALEGIDDIELLQIQEYTPWRAIRFDTTNCKGLPANYPIHRGTVIPLDSESFLLWTHGCIQHNDLLGAESNYYKNRRGIPSPLLVKRFYGKASGDILTSEILMLTKMNWNSGDSLYKQLPVTLDFAKILSRMSKQNEAIYDKPYDFRYFM